MTTGEVFFVLVIPFGVFLVGAAVLLVGSGFEGSGYDPVDSTSV